VDGSARKDLVEALLPVVRPAGIVVMELRDAHLTTRPKQDKSPVTSTDLEIHAIIEEGCSRLAPAVPMISDDRTFSFVSHEVETSDVGYVTIQVSLSDRHASPRGGVLGRKG